MLFRWVLQAMELYNQIEGRHQAISEMAPNVVRSLLYNVLSLQNHGSSIRSVHRLRRGRL